MSTEEKYMSRCLELAKCGFGNVAPNPMVGCVIVYKDKIIGEGYHQKYGEAHAEVNAINSVKDKELLIKSTLFVNLEPCAHYGKTPPCADLIIKNKIPNVVIGCIDSFSEVAGKGIEKLKNAGIKVTTGMLEQESLLLNKRFFTFHNKKRPYIILKWAQTIDGFIDKERKANETASIISNQFSHQLSHLWRTQESAIMVGTKTVAKDNPTLTAREAFGNNPIRITIDKNLKLDSSNNIFNNEAKTIVFNAINEETKGNISYKKIEFNKNIIPQLLYGLHNENIQSIIIEGGRQLINSFIEKNLWDEARIFMCDKIFGSGIKAPNIPLGKNTDSYRYDQIGNDKLITITK